MCYRKSLSNGKNMNIPELEIFPSWPLTLRPFVDQMQLDFSNKKVDVYIS